MFCFVQTIQILKDTVQLHSSTVQMVHSFHCLFVNEDCETRMLSPLSQRNYRCPNEDHLMDVLAAIAKNSREQNSSYDHGRNSSAQSVFSSYTCAESTFQNLHTAAIPRIGSLVVQSLKYMRASFVAFDVLIKLSSHCFAGAHSDVHNLLHDINYVKGHLRSFFLKQGPDISIEELNRLLMETYEHLSEGSSELCSTMILKGYLSSVREITDVSHRHLQLLLRFTQSEYKWSIIVQSVYFIVLSSLPLICGWQFVEFWRRLVLVQKLSQRYNTATEQLMKENMEFKSILGEVIPRSNFCEVVSEGSTMSLVSSAFRVDSHCEPVQVSFSDTEQSDDGEETERHIRNSRLSMINRFKQKGNLMGTIHEVHSIYDKITKKLSSKTTDPSPSNEVTIFRSDIVGFSRIIKCFTPSEIVNLVSYLMKLFDERIQLYDVFVLGREADLFTVISGKLALSCFICGFSFFSFGVLKILAFTLNGWIPTSDFVFGE